MRNLIIIVITILLTLFINSKITSKDTVSLYNGDEELVRFKHFQWNMAMCMKYNDFLKKTESRNNFKCEIN